ncbi:protoplast secreted protein 2 precursor putative [Thamnocephalis sphaerospora]|uniref:Protoplast secreted protein 2 putative n=1 Tax=Thamnocephalis sphaerospora TaxID=78915 RepID=A0A4P9XQ85_9FUNG|nr:protoplast secreted protein 2 precursor putative [Thamnocephalis sphaerospora]|eukprot:RKP08186.1 protoplast secreted protein 2 precursor putative [Thamnocephalis sphaerospora]
MSAKIYIVYYSVYGHVEKLARAMQVGAKRIPGVDVSLYQMPETLSDEILAQIKAPPKPADVPVISPLELADADGLLIGIPTRFGLLPAQAKALFDGTGSLWANNTLRNKLVGTFFSTNTQHGGQETTALSMLPYFSHLGLHYVPFGFSHPALSRVDEVLGGSAYGAGTVALASGDRPVQAELDVAEAQGEHFAQETLFRVLGRQTFEKLHKAEGKKNERM